MKLKVIYTFSDRGILQEEIKDFEGFQNIRDHYHNYKLLYKNVTVSLNDPNNDQYILDL